MATSFEGVLYFADGRDLRTVDLSTGIIATLSTADPDNMFSPQPVGCEWETEVASYQFR